jgi:hypothetical protein
MKIAISGCRTARWKDYSKLEAFVPQADCILVGDCPTGVDHYVRQWCSDNFYAVRVFGANWIEFKDGAGPIRNRAMVKEADLLIAFWDGKSRGTLSAIKEAALIRVPVRIYPV